MGASLPLHKHVYMRSPSVYNLLNPSVYNLLDPKSTGLISQNTAVCTCGMQGCMLSPEVSHQAVSEQRPLL